MPGGSEPRGRPKRAAGTEGVVVEDEVVSGGSSRRRKAECPRRRRSRREMPGEEEEELGLGGRHSYLEEEILANKAPKCEVEEVVVQQTEPPILIPDSHLEVVETRTVVREGVLRSTRSESPTLELICKTEPDPDDLVYEINEGPSSFTAGISDEEEEEEDILISEEETPYKDDPSDETYRPPQLESEDEEDDEEEEEEISEEEIGYKDDPRDKSYRPQLNRSSTGPRRRGPRTREDTAPVEVKMEVKEENPAAEPEAPRNSIMGPKKVSRDSSTSKKNARNTIELKKEIIAKYESGIKIAEIGRMYGKSPSTISSIVAKKEAIKEANVAKGVDMLTKRRSQTMEEVEKLLLIWINSKQLNGDSVSQAIICEKARLLYADLLQKLPEATASVLSDFKASRGWLDKFKRRTGIRSGTRRGEAATSDRSGAETFVSEFKDYVEAEGLVPQQVFNCDETGLFWKKMPKRTFITQEEKALPGHKPIKDRLTLLLCGNASGDCKVKPLLVYHSEAPRAFSRNKVITSKLCVMWRANRKAWVTRPIFIEWMNEVFGPSVKKYLQDNQLPLKCLLVMDNAPAHPPGLEDALLEEFSFISVKFLPANATPLIQPMDQRVISNFKKLYTKAVFERCFEVTSDTKLSLREFWKNHFNILNCIGLIDKAWQGVTCRTMISAWKKLWPGCVPERDLEGSEPSPDDPIHMVQSIVDLGKSMGLEVSVEDVEELVDDPSEELTTEELQDLHLEMQQTADGEEETGEDVPSSEIKDILSMWSKVQGFVEKNHPDKAVAGRVCNLFNDNALPYFRQILKRRQKRTSMDSILGQHRSTDSESGPSAKRPNFPSKE
ncbi:E3 ubiquitin-protein ligase ZFP91 isoform X1 [Eleutherodactylus coqui]|uniref:E3 ubiquitin-protein ligase ZFP91 isoform X1 n=1 Tax=Eleutherodactylus coqui TaxID=57060 RepID=UPI003462691D